MFTRIRRCSVLHSSRYITQFGKQMIKSFATASSSNQGYLQRIRNIGVFAHIDAGKTTTTEKMLYYAGIVRNPGNVDDGDTVTDFLQEERDRGITIQSAAISFPWKNSIINLIDTPGHVDFTIEVERCLRVLDGGIAILDGVAGVEAQTETVWEQANRYKLPRLLYVNKMDRIGANFSRSIQMVKDHFGADCLQLQLPYFDGDSFSGIIDVLHQKLIQFDENEEGAFQEVPIPESMIEQSQDTLNTLMMQVAEADEQYSDYYLEGKEEEMKNPSNILSAIRRILIQSALDRSFSLIPVFCGSSLKNKGVQHLLDGVDALLPSPVDVALPDLFFTVNKQLTSLPYQQCLTNPPKTVPSGLTRFLKKDPLIMYAFKLQYTTQGMLVYARIYKGSLKTKVSLMNTRTRKQEKVLRIMQVSADHTDTLNEAREGQIVALHGLQGVKTGDTLIGSSNAFPFMLEPIHISTPVFTVNVEADNQVQMTKLEKVLQVLVMEDPSLVFKNDEESGQLLLSGMGELHLEVIQQRLKREFGLDLYFSRMRVNYHETIAEGFDTTQEYNREINNRSYKIQLGFSVSQTEETENSIKIPVMKFDKAVAPMTDDTEKFMKEGIQSCLSRGPLFGYPMTNLKVELDPSKCMWDGQTPAVVLQSAVIACLSEALRNHQLLLTEPIMNYESCISNDVLGNVLSDLTSKRRGEVNEVETIESGSSVKCLIHASVPLAEMIGYSSVIRMLTGGESSFSMRYQQYATVPEDVVDQLKKKGIYYVC